MEGRGADLMVRQQAQEVVNFSAFLSFPFFNNPHRRHQEMEEKGCLCQFWLSHGLGGEAEVQKVRRTTENLDLAR
jgi:hypothetical protein